jgi:hypothetical protein
MGRGISANADFAVFAVVAVFTTGLFIAWAAHGFTWSAGHQRRTALAHRSVPARRAATPARPAANDRGAGRRPRSRRHAAVQLSVVAARGEAWLSIREGSATGRTLYEGLLARRHGIKVAGSRLVVSLGASANLDAKLGRRSTDLAPYAMRQVTITASGIHAAPVAPGPPQAPAIVAS